MLFELVDVSLYPIVVTEQIIPSHNPQQCLGGVSILVVEGLKFEIGDKRLKAKAAEGGFNLKQWQKKVGVSV